MKKMLIIMILLTGAMFAQNEMAVKTKLTPDKKAPVKLDTESLADSIYVEADKMPEPVGGMEAIMKLVVYPEEAMKKGLEGMVVVSGVIDEKGNVIKTKVEKSIGSGCDEAALKALTSTKWIPGEVKGKKVKVKIALPVMFKLK
ncbi:MAG: hypothetical protein HBSAPP04_02940 [Ignavibacteriaceae bacterium]|nr:MAG: energy transducer TonB [Chlorobiota bacterium]GJQ31455.1 MAG: hypothetical protein HBSAPP04_02940 [Ignavibacteriaceae bacterium]